MQQAIQNLFKNAGIGISFDPAGPATLRVLTNVPIPGALRQDPNLGNTVSINNAAIGRQAVALSNGDPNGALLMAQQATAVVIAHEFGHYLLQQGHPEVRNVGIMHPGNEQATLPFYKDLAGQQNFTRKQATKIRKRCTELTKNKGGIGGSSSGGDEWIFWQPWNCGSEGCFCWTRRVDTLGRLWRGRRRPRLRLFFILVMFAPAVIF
jgi:hypothetical protein